MLTAISLLKVLTEGILSPPFKFSLEIESSILRATCSYKKLLPAIAKNKIK
ncbi:hypothetical protein EDF67_104259 [Sphingobacterium sp. JUb78]|nr:hypothetical protein [Sphingobacterium kitahiroshimense]TCR11166.1 hypothetical protein EDF67_104259 [Sphingobacterium sp. JUb78]